jgi:hypothetical protein
MHLAVVVGEETGRVGVASRDEAFAGRRRAVGLQAWVVPRSGGKTTLGNCTARGREWTSEEAGVLRGRGRFATARSD